MENNTGIERNEAESAGQYLTRLKEMGFLFHGSENTQIEELEPRYTVDLKSEDNTDTAVFATSNVTWTTIFGVYGGHKGWRTIVKDGQVVARIPKEAKEIIDNTKGVVYVLPRDSFKQSSLGFDQWKSHVPVKPVEKVSVTVQDFYDLGGKIEWV